MAKDRLGFERCNGYKKEKFEICSKCKGKGYIKKFISKIICNKCGGYGEVSIKFKSPSLKKILQELS